MLRTNDLGHELRFWSMPAGEPITVSRFYRDLPWVSATVTLGYHCQGIFRYRADGTGVNAVDRSADQQLLVSADEIGQLNLFRYPCVKGETPVASNRRSFFAHSSAALGCRWVGDGPTPPPDGQRVVSIGGFDLTLMQWRRAAVPHAPPAPEPAPRSEAIGATKRRRPNVSPLSSNASSLSARDTREAQEAPRGPPELQGT